MVASDVEIAKLLAPTTLFRVPCLILYYYFIYKPLPYYNKCKACEVIPDFVRLG